MLSRPFAVLALSILLGQASALTAATPPTYTLSWATPAGPYYMVELTTAAAGGKYTDFRMPAWRPGRYFLQNFAAAVGQFAAKDAQGKPLPVAKPDKDTWRVANPRQGGAITVAYQVYARTMDAGSSYLAPDYAYFNPATLLVYVPGRLDSPCTLRVPSMPSSWQAATQLGRTAEPNVFTASSYHDLIDSPTILSPSLKTFSLQVDGATFYVHFQGKYGAPASADAQYVEAASRIIREQTAVFGELPLKEYQFIYLLCPFTIRHAVEHTRSAMFAMPESVAASAESLAGLYSITSHEFWHLWNVKRVRPAAMWPYQYAKEAYTSLHWLTEGITSYYSEVALARAGLLTRPQLLAELSKTITGLENNPGQQVISPSRASTDSWLAGSAYQDPHTRISYYDLGTRVGLLLDLKLRTLTRGKASLDDVFRYLYNTYYKKGKGVPENGIRLAAERVAGQSMGSFFDQYVDKPAPIDYAAVLGPAGLALTSAPVSGGGLARLGIDRYEIANGTTTLFSVQPGSDAAKAGIMDRSVLRRINGSDNAEQFEALVNALEPGQTLTLETTSLDGPRTHSLIFTGQSVPRTFTLSETGSNPSLLDSWVAPRSK